MDKAKFDAIRKYRKKRSFKIANDSLT